jgi:uncharacterized membrane protein HdeD (DUF308 family)
MPLKCNIDAKGKSARLINGIVLIVVGLVLMCVWPMRSESIFAWAVTIILILGGAFMVFEARAGWCVIRAMGWKTPM